MSASPTDEEAETKYTPPDEKPTDRDVVIVIVTRDGRGGITAFSQTLP